MNLETAFQKTTGLSLKEGIEKAIEGGWDGKIVAPDLKKYDRKEYKEGYEHARYCVILLDPLFWQSLGKALGWSAIDALDADIKTQPVWANKMHSFIDALIESVKE